MAPPESPRNTGGGGILNWWDLASHIFVGPLEKTVKLLLLVRLPTSTKQPLRQVGWIGQLGFALGFCWKLTRVCGGCFRHRCCKLGPISPIFTGPKQLTYIRGEMTHLHPVLAGRLSMGRGTPTFGSHTLQYLL